MPTRKRGLQSTVDAGNRSTEEHPLADREGRNEDALIVPLSRLRPDPNQPRKVFDETALRELSHSIEEHGVLQPLIVYGEGGLYYIVAGERRYRAAQLAGQTAVPVQVVHDRSRIKELQLVENLQREDLTLMDEARALHDLQAVLGASVRGLEQATGKSKSYVSRRLALLKMPLDVQRMLEVSPQLFSQAEVVAQIADPERRQVRIDALLQKPLPGGQAVKRRSRGRPVKPFDLKKKRSGAFDLVVKYRPGESDVASLVSQLKALVTELENNLKAS